MDNPDWFRLKLEFGWKGIKPHVAAVGWALGDDDDLERDVGEAFARVADAMFRANDYLVDLACAAAAVLLMAGDRVTDLEDFTDAERALILAARELLRLRE